MAEMTDPPAIPTETPPLLVLAPPRVPETPGDTLLTFEEGELTTADLLTPYWREFANLTQRRLLAALVVTGSPTRAAMLVGVALTQHGYWQKRDSRYAEAAVEAVAAYHQLVEGVAARRAIYGWEKPIYQGGKLVGHERQYDHTLLWRYLQAILPDRFGTKVDLRHRITVAPADDWNEQQDAAAYRQWQQATYGEAVEAETRILPEPPAQAADEREPPSPA